MRNLSVASVHHVQDGSRSSRSPAGTGPRVTVAVACFAISPQGSSPAAALPAAPDGVGPVVAPTVPAPAPGGGCFAPRRHG